MKNIIFVVYDQRWYFDPDSATILFATSNRAEAEEYANENLGVVVEEVAEEVQIGA